jgi:4-amino-4-deoxy-L-arabinose transferase-like glycosyltransferase
LNAVASSPSVGAETLGLRLRTLSRYRIAEAVILAVSAALTIAWIAVDRTPPAWDQARYLTDSLQYVHGLRQDGLSGAVNAFFSADRYYAPGYPAFLFPFELIFGSSVQSALIANLVLWIVLLMTVAAIGRQLFGEMAGIIALAVTATIPELLFFLHQALIDIPAATCACLALLAMLRTSHFTRPAPSALVGVMVGIGLLTKATVAVFLVGPALVIGVRALLRLRTAPNAELLRVAGNLLLAAALAVAIAGPWYVTNWDTTLAYLQSSASGEGARGMGPSNPLDPAAVLAFTNSIVTVASFALVAGIAILGLVRLYQRIQPPSGGPRKSGNRAKRRWSWALLAAWTLVPLFFFGMSHNQDPRQAMFVYPGMAIVFAGLSVITRPRILRVGLVAVVLSVCIAQALVAQLPPLNPIRDAAYLNLTVGSTTVVLFQPSFGVANPTGDDGTPVMKQLETAADGRPARVLVAQEDHVFNPNTLTWLGETRQDRYTFEDPQALTGDPAELAGYDFAIYMPAAEVQRRNGEPRLLILNQSSATTAYADQLFAIFSGGKHRVVLGDGTTVWVLQR